MLYIDGHWDTTDFILEYDDFMVVKIKIDGTERYYYYETGTNDCDEFYEVEPVAVLTYNMLHDIKIKQGLEHLFDCDCCGEHIGSESIKYLWFKKKKGGGGISRKS